MLSHTRAGDTAGTRGMVMNSLFGGIQWGLDRMLAVAYGVVYDYIFERFPPYQDLLREILSLLEAGTPASVSPKDVKVLDIGCGTGNFTFALAQAGFLTLGIDPYGPLVDLAREKRRAQHVTNLAFRQVDLAKGDPLRDRSFDHVVNVHSLYVHPEPDRFLAAAYRVLKPGGHAVFVNFTRRVELWSTFRQLRDHDGLSPALRCLLWVLPNAIFEATRKRVGPHYWEREEFSSRLQRAGFTVLEMRPTFFNRVSLLAWARRDSEEGATP